MAGGRDDDRGGLRRLEGLRRVVWVDPVLEPWLAEAGLMRASRPEHLEGARTDQARGRGLSVRIEAAGQPELIAKSLRHGGLFAPLLGERFCGARRLMGLLALVVHLRERGVATPAVAFARSHRSAWSFLRRLDFAARRIPGAVDLDARLVDEPAWPGRHREARAIGRLLRDLHDAGIDHADLNARNLLIDADGGAWIVDLEGSRNSGAALDRGPRVRNLERLLRSLRKRGHWPGTISRQDLARTLRVYDVVAWRELWRAIASREARTGPWHRAWWWLSRRSGRTR